MSAWIPAHDRVVAEGAHRVFSTRAAALRRRAAELTAHITDQWGRPVAIPSPEAVVMTRTAALLDECAADVLDAVRP